MTTITTIRVLYADVDLMKVVHNARYFEYFERGRLDFLETNIMPYKDLVEKEGIQIPVTSNLAKYYRPALYDDQLDLVTEITGFTRKRIAFGYKLYKDGILLCEGKSEHAFIAGGLMKAIEMPELFARFLKKENVAEWHYS